MNPKREEYYIYIHALWTHKLQHIKDNKFVFIEIFNSKCELFSRCFLVYRIVEAIVYKSQLFVN